MLKSIRANVAGPTPAQLPARIQGFRLLPAVRATKGFGSGEGSSPASSPQESTTAATSTPTSTKDREVEELEARIRRRRARKVEPQVKVQSAAVDAVTGRGPAPPTAQAETTYLSAMFFLFTLILIEGLLIAGSGFLPEDWDTFVQYSLYPSYTPTVVTFLAASTVYGLWKVGKLPLPFMGAPPQDPPGRS